MSKIKSRTILHLKYSLIPVLLILTYYASASGAGVYNVVNYGAKADGKTLDTKAINRAIDACNFNGGGIVAFPPGTYLSGSIHLKSNIIYLIQAHATILGAPNNIHAYDSVEPNKWGKYQDFGHSHFHDALMWGANLVNISFTGGGVINGGGITRGVPLEGGGDKAISLKLCRNISLSDITIRQGGHMAILADGCNGVTLDSVKIRTGRGGVSLVACSDVDIRNSEIRCVRYKDGKMVGGDDAISIKSDYAIGPPPTCEDIVIANCFLSSGCNAIQIGSETVGPISDVLVSHCTIVHADKAGLGVTSCDGGMVDSVTFDDIRMTKTATPIFMLVTDRGRAPGRPSAGGIKNVLFENITATDAYGYIKRRKFTSTISGLPEHPIENVTFRNIRITYKGGGTTDQAKIAPPYPSNYSPRFLGVRPASGFYCREARNLKFENVSIRFEKKDLRPVLVFQNVAGVTLDQFSAQKFSGVGSEIVLRKVTNFSKSHCDNLRVKRVA